MQEGMSTDSNIGNGTCTSVHVLELILEPVWRFLDRPTKRSIRICNHATLALANDFITRLVIRSDESRDDMHEAQGKLLELWPNVSKVTMHIRNEHSEAVLSSLLSDSETWKWTDLSIQAFSLDASQQDQLLDRLPVCVPHLRNLSLHGLSSSAAESGIPHLKYLRCLTRLTLYLEGPNSNVDTVSF